MWYKLAIDTEFWNKDKSNDPKDLNGLFMGVITDSKTRTSDVDKIKTNLEQEKRKVIEEAKYSKEDIEAAFDKAMKSLEEIEDKKPDNFINPVDGSVNSKFGPREKPTPGASSNHKGVDLKASQGQSVKASADGVVSFAGEQRGYGNIVIIDHNGDIQTAYAHLSSIKLNKYDDVKQGDIIGNAGQTGTATGPHLHFEVRSNGTQVDPMDYIK
jgi:murein DD-endopeptidase MepM/ murein hydrolase activator NlpD